MALTVVTSAKTLITVQRSTGEVETIEKPGTIIDRGVRRKITEATRVAGRGEIIGWKVVTTTAKAGCLHYTVDQGCPLHGETCR